MRLATWDIYDPSPSPPPPFPPMVMPPPLWMVWSVGWAIPPPCGWYGRLGVGRCRPPPPVDGMVVWGGDAAPPPVDGMVGGGGLFGRFYKEK